MDNAATRQQAPGATIDADGFRRVLGQYPTGVVVVASAQADGPPVALTVGSFASVSLEPPLVAFYPAKSSSTWPKIEASGSFCVNILGADQERLCRNFAMSSQDKFRDVSWRPSGTGSPLIDGVVAWIDCTIESVQELGDHYLVVGRVQSLDIESGHLPLLFFRGGYGRFTPLSLATGDLNLMSQLRGLDRIRSEMESLAQDLRVECLAGARIADEFVLLAGAAPDRRGAELSRVGRRMPFVAPLGAPIAAWTDNVAESGWFGSSHPHEGIDRQTWVGVLRDLRRDGYFVGYGDSVYAEIEEHLSLVDGTLRAPNDDLHSAVAKLRSRSAAPNELDSWSDYEVRTMSAPVFSEDGTVLQLSLYGFPATITGSELRQVGKRLVEGARRASELLKGTIPSP